MIEQARTKALSLVARLAPAHAPSRHAVGVLCGASGWLLAAMGADLATGGFAKQNLAGGLAYLGVAAFVAGTGALLLMVGPDPLAQDA